MPSVALATQARAKSQTSSKPGHSTASKAPLPSVQVHTAVPVKPVPSGPAIKLSVKIAESNPRFRRVIERLEQSAKRARTHLPASKKARDAQAAALPPAREKVAGAQVNSVKAMEEADTAKPDSRSFLAMLRSEIHKVMPKKTEDAGNFMKGKDREQLKGAMTGNVGRQKEEATAGLKSASAQPPDTSKVQGKAVTPLPGDKMPGLAPAVDAREGMPEPRPDTEVSLEKGKDDANQLMRDAEVTTPQLQKANDSRFTAVVTAKSELDKQADTAPKVYRAKEKGILGQAVVLSGVEEKKALSAFQAQGVRSALAVKSRQLTAKEKDERERKRVTDHIEALFSTTKGVVDRILVHLDDEVASRFDAGADAAVAKMKAYIEKRFDARYSGLVGKGRWVKDKLLPLPDEVKAWFDEAHAAFLNDLDLLVVAIANLVEKRLKEAKDTIAQGQKDIREYVDALPDNLKAVGKAAEKEIEGRFDELRRGVDDKKSDLAQNLAGRFKDATEKGAKALQEMKDAHKSLYERVRDAIGEVIKILREFRDRIMAMLRKSKNAIDIIVADPIGFLKNLLKALGKGVSQFIDNITTHLKAGFIAFLFGSLAEAGIEAPADLSLGSLLKLVLQVLGLTYDRIRAKAVKHIGERNVAILEKVFQFLKALITGGPEKLWEMMKEYLSDLKERIVGEIQEWLITTIIKAAAMKLISMFNPVGAIIQAIVTIYNVVMFFIERINQILAFVEAIVNSVFEIATGAIDKAANWIEKSLARIVPLIIAFLARLLGISGITERIVKIIKKIQAKVDNAIDKVIGKIAAGIGKAFGAVKTAAGKILEWWKTRRVFTAKGGEKHSILFEGEGRNARLFIESSPRAYLPYIKDLDAGKDPERQKAKSAAMQTAKRIDALVARVSTKDGTKEETKEFSDLCQLLADQTKVFIDRTDALPASAQPEYGDTTAEGGYGTSMTIEPLTRIGPPGSVPSASSEKWERLNLRREGGRSYFVRGHLLNHNIHGPGTTWKNLTPLSQKGNKNHLTLVESTVKTAVEHGDTVSYRVVAKFGRKLNTRLLGALDRSSRRPAEKERIRQVIEGESLVPSHLICEAKSVKIDMKTGKKSYIQLIAKNTKVENPVQDDEVNEYATK
jgi:hypothetical protein